MSIENTGMIPNSENISPFTDEFEEVVAGLDVGTLSEYLAERIIGLEQQELKVVSIIGGPASGKSTLTESVIAQLNSNGVSADSISTDDFNLGTRQWRWEHERDNPLSLKDFGLLNKLVGSIRTLDAQSGVFVPKYDGATGVAIGEGEETWTRKINKIDVLFVEGDFDAVDLEDLAIFVDAPKEDRLQARINRDLVERGQVDADIVAASFESRHQHQYIPLTEPARHNADLVIAVDISAKDSWAYSVFQRRV